MQTSGAKVDNHKLKPGLALRAKYRITQEGRDRGRGMGCGDTPRASSVTGSFQSLFVTMDDSSGLTTAAVDLEESLRAKGEEDERRAVTGAEDEQPVVTGAVAEIAQCPSENHAIDLAESLRAKGEEDEPRAVTGAEDEEPVVTGAVA